jgi:hypothetical protein
MTSTSIYIENLHKSCVYLVTYSGDKLPTKFKNSNTSPNKYIGSVFVEKIINEDYRGSVGSKKYKKLWKEELIENPHLFHIDILSYHNDRKDAYDEEERLQKELDVANSEEYINMCIANKKFCNLECSEETKQKMSIAKTGVSKSKEHCKKISISKKGKPGRPQKEESNRKQSIAKKGKKTGRIVTTETRRKMSISHTGKPRKPHSEETKNKLRVSSEGNNNRSTPIMFNDVLYPSIKEAIKASGLSYDKFKKIREVSSST